MGAFIFLGYSYYEVGIPKTETNKYLDLISNIIETEKKGINKLLVLSNENKSSLVLKQFFHSTLSHLCKNFENSKQFSFIP